MANANKDLHGSPLAQPRDKNARMACSPGYRTKTRRRLIVHLLICYCLAAASLSGIQTNSVAQQTNATIRLKDYMEQLGYSSIRLWRDRDNHLTVRGEAGGKEWTFLIDTGWPITILDRQLARKLKNAPPAVIKDPTTPGTIRRAILLDLTIGDIVFTNQSARIDLTLKENPVGGGILGYDFLARNSCVIDCLDQWLFSRSAEPSTSVSEELVETLLRSGFSEIQAAPTPTFAMVVDAQANAEPAELLVDTGYPWSAVHRKQSLRLHLKPRWTPYQMRGVQTRGAQLFADKIACLQMGSFCLTNVDVAVIDLSGWGLGRRGGPLNEISGLLGGDFLALNRAIIDCHGRKLWLNASTKDSNPE